MKRIGVLSDTHGTIIPQVFDFFKDVDEIWHAGDIGNIETAEQLEAFKPLRAVHGNIDDHIVRLQYPEDLFFQVEDVHVYMTHIGGYPGHYMPEVRHILQEKRPELYRKKSFPPVKKEIRSKSVKRRKTHKAFISSIFESISDITSTLIGYI